MFERYTRELTPEEEEKMIQGAAKRIVNLGLEAPAVFFLEANKPLVGFEVQMYGLFLAPFLDLFGFDGYKYYKLYSKEGVIERILKKVEELTAKKKQAKS